MINRILSNLFPPALTPLDHEALTEAMAYHSRITRRGVDRNPTAWAGVQIVRVVEGAAKVRPPKGTRGAGKKSTPKFSKTGNTFMPLPREITTLYEPF